MKRGAAVALERFRACLGVVSIGERHVPKGGGARTTSCSQPV